jgi:hypothetical protein
LKNRRPGRPNRLSYGPPTATWWRESNRTDPSAKNSEESSLELASADLPAHDFEMLPLQTRIDRAHRLLRMLEQDAPLLALRVAELAPERQESAKAHAAKIRVHTQLELERLLAERAEREGDGLIPQPAD